ncbi:type II CAAX prenyl endopeptidase Rce1 family protein [uncultured Adlercreutzia sp.]|uniref:CPBP family glutamic-type intramembrane protease n=1 Tax=uncultured Adlercreutzia sp. TaxID=875803 RepID=UPI0025DE02C3|nr:CPBP family glutamic-type intramembrane protease [uncultured Adlercreutzia sp.]MCI9262266.1 CPBP family intramembrane metalloprotease [Eggerthellaceae bacterium]
MTAAPHCNRIAAVPVVLVLLAGLVGGVGTMVSAGVLWSASLEGVGNAMAVAVETSVVEEVLFRGVVLWGLIAWWGRGCTKQAATKQAATKQAATKHAVIASAVLFGVLHLAPDGPLVSESAWAAAEATGAPWLILAGQAVLKVVQATLFGVIMARFVVRSPWFQEAGWQRARSLLVPLVIHFAFDMLYLGIPLCAGLSLPDSYLTGSVGDMATLALTAFLLALALKADC